MAIERRSEIDKWVKCISSGGTIRAIAISATDTVQAMAEKHGLKGTAAKSLGEALVAGLILSSYSKGEEKINLNIHGSGWCHQAIVDANAEAEIRGYILERPHSEISIARNIGPWGIGLLSVLRTKHEDAQPYIGTVPLLTGHLAKDLTFYWLQSEQVQTAVGIEVFIENDQIKMAEGFLIQALPEATNEDLSTIEDHLKKLHEVDPAAPIRSTPVNLLSYLLEDKGFNLLEEKAITFKCGCSLDRVKRSLLLVGPDELRSMVKENQDFHIHCDFCSEKYTLTPPMIEMLADKGLN